MSCKPEPDPNPVLPDLTIRDSDVFERDEPARMLFEVVALDSVAIPIDFTYQIIPVTAEPDVDFVLANGSGTIEAGNRSVNIEVQILGDDLNEMDEKLIVTITSASNAKLVDSTGTGVIVDDDAPVPTDADGYITAESIYGYDLVWQDEFDGTELDPASYNIDIGDGCPNLCGWGNDEKQWYTDDPSNLRLEDGKMILTATKTGTSDYQSARVQTKGKKEFKFGRIDIRAKLPKGQGIWPAIWMLGQNIDDVGWPACGEIDIMELVGHQPKTVHGTAHWGPQGRGYSTYSTSSYFIDQDFQEAFHVFSLVWELNQMVWYVDETRFKTITSKDMQGETYRFNQDFYFIFNIAVGGRWPGLPDETTVFPQTMEIDYVRVFQ
ncbi:MAG: glycoside hydrolase family 16 protein [Bacteroidota bacterium]